MKMDYLNLKSINQPYQEAIEAAIHEVVERGWYLQGKAVSHFEQEYAQYVGTNHCVTCGNGLDALKLMLMAELELGRLQKGDEVIVAANTYIATLLAITETGLQPVLVEPSLETLQIDDAQIEAAITHKTKAVMLVHLYGKCAMTHHIATLCQKHHLLLLEDNAQGHGCIFRDTKGQLHHTGSLGDAAAHSFYPGKNLGALGDAGAVTTNDEQLAQTIRALGNYGSTQKYVFPYRGLNSRMDEIQAAVLSVKLPHLDQDNQKRKELAQEYCHCLAPLQAQDKDFYLPIEMYRKRYDNVVHIFPILTPRRKALQAYLHEKGIGTMIHYPIPPHQQDCYPLWHDCHLPITERIHAEELSLPCHPMMSRADVRYVAENIIEFFNS